MPFDRQKFKSLVHYICWKVDDPEKLGATKLNKICWLADFTAYYDLGASITDAKYIKRPFGPVPEAIEPTLRQLQLENKLRIREVPFHGQPKKEFISLVDPSDEMFSPKELEIIDWATDFVSNIHTAKSISDASHDHIWQAATDREEIPYYTIFAIPGEITQTEIDWARQEIEGLR